MATILEEVVRLGVDPNLAIAAMSMPSRANITGATRYTIPGEGASEFIRPKTAEEIAVAARALGESATPNRYAGQVFGNTIGQSQGYALQVASQRQEAAQFQQKLNAAARQSQNALDAETSLRRQTAAENARIRQQNDILDFVAAMSGVDARNYATDSRSGGTVGGTRTGTGAGTARTVRSSANRIDPMATTVADQLYDTLARIRDEQADAEAPAMREITDAVAAISGKYNVAPTYDENGIPSFGGAEDPKVQEAFLGSPDWSSKWGEDGPTSTIGQTLAKIMFGRQDAAVRSAGIKDDIAAAKASKRLDLPVSSNRGAAPVSPLARLLLQMPATVGSDGMLTYSPGQTAEALTRLGWRGAYGDPAAQARADAMSRYRAMGLQPTVDPEPAPAPARQGFGDLRVSESTPITQRFTLAPRSDTVAPNVGSAYAGMGVLPRGGVPGYRPDPATMAEVEARRQAGEFPATTDFVNKYPEWVRRIFALPGETVPRASAYPQGAGSVADFTDVSTPAVAPSAIERLLTNGYPSPAPVNGTFNMNDSTKAIADILRAVFSRVGQAGRNVLEYGYPSPAPVGGGTFNLADAMPVYR